VSCTSATVCTAVGYYIKADLSPQLALTERWDGSTWTIQTTLSPSGTTSSTLSGVWCTSDSVCTAAGSYSKAAGPQVALTERYSG
jgi:hypothetical protein